MFLDVLFIDVVLSILFIFLLSIYFLIRVFIAAPVMLYHLFFYKREQINTYFVLEYSRIKPKRYKICMRCDKAYHNKDFKQNKLEFRKCIDSLSSHLNCNTEYIADTHQIILNRIKRKCKNKDVEVSEKEHGKMCLSGLTTVLEGRKYLASFINMLIFVNFIPKKTFQYRVIIKVGDKYTT